MPLVAVDLPDLVGHPATRLSMDVRYAGALLVSRSDDGLRVWDNDGHLRRAIPGNFSHLAVVSEALAVVGTKDHAIAWDLATGAPIRSYATGWDWVEGLAADGDEVLIRDDSALGVLRYDRRGNRLTVPEALARSHGPLEISPSGVIWFVDRLEHLTAWDPASGETWSDDRPGRVARLEFDPTGGWMAAAVWDWPRAHLPVGATPGLSGTDF